MRDDAMQLGQTLTRRALLARGGTSGVGALALGSLLAGDARGETRDPKKSAGPLKRPRLGGTDVNPLAERRPHFAPRAKNVIFIHMVGAPSHLDLYDHKPELIKYDGKPCPDEHIKGKRFAFIRGHPKLLGTKYKFKKYADGGVELSELLPHLATVADEMCVLKGLHSDQINHGPAQLFFHTGFGVFGRPTLGSWLSYGLGTSNRNLPSFVVLITGSIAGAGNSLWGSGFLPTIHQGIEFRSSGDPVLFLSNPKGIDGDARRRIVDSINTLNRAQLADVGDPEIATRISQYEMAYRMQTSVPELMDIKAEPKHVLDAYGANPAAKGESFANNCLLARRLVERGVRYVQLFDQGWDHHGGVFDALPRKTKQVDQPIAALIRDLKTRGLLDDTLVVWGAEFGRTPLLQSDRSKPGRDHHKEAFSIWMAGGGVRGGYTFGQTDPLGYSVAENSMHVNDFHATLLHLMGMDHERLTFKFQGRPFRLTDVGGNVAFEVMG